MVQVIENRADVEGRVVAVRPADARPACVTVTIDIVATAAVPGYPNLFASAVGTRLDVVLSEPPPPALSNRRSQTIWLRIRRAGPFLILGEPCSARDGEAKHRN